MVVVETVMGRLEVWSRYEVVVVGNETVVLE